MRRWLINLIGRWRARRAKARELEATYRTYEENKAKLENGEEL